MIYSYTSLSTFKQCSFKYKLKYIKKVDVELPVIIETFLGSRVHDTLEKLYQDLKNNKRNSIEELIQYYNQQWNKHWSDDIIITKKQYGKKNYKKMGEQYIHTFYNQYTPFNQEKTIAIEKHFIINLDNNGKYKLQGYIDRLAERESGYYEIHDYKTNTRLPSLQKIKNDPQLALYALSIKEKYSNTTDIQLIWHFLKFNKEIKFSITDAELIELKKNTINLIEKIEKKQSFQPEPSYHCNWCEFKPLCPHWSYLYTSKYELKKEKPVNSAKFLVDRYVHLKKETKQMNLNQYVEIEKLEKEIIAFAEKKQVEILTGVKNQIQIEKQKQYTLPSKESNIWKKLKQELKKKEKWNEFKQIDKKKLSNMLLEKKLDGDLLKILTKYMKYSELKPILHIEKKPPHKKKSSYLTPSNQQL